MNVADFVAHEATLDGTRVTIRSIRSSDKAKLLAAFRNLEPTSIRMRFFHAKKDLSDDDLRRLTEVDHRSHVALVATVGSPSDETIIGVGRYVASEDKAEMAFTVEEDYQRRGIATSLLNHLARVAREAGLASIEADVLEQNEPMLAILRRSGFPMTISHTGEVVHVTLALDVASEA